MTTLLESRYRAVLRLLPAYYRRERGEEMVEVCLRGVDPDTQDQSWAPASGFLVCALGWLLWRARSSGRGGAGTLALAFLGLLVLALRVAALVPWLDVSVPGVVVAGFVGQAVAVALLTVALAVVGGRDLAAR
ncbi:hypothetical protein [Streptomyces griseosporeus]|uniref:hypothetical protein n=1 Tax=Streptomyces griseosporeus TaxID=1910 RepID=UPI0036CA5606